MNYALSQRRKKKENELSEMKKGIIIPWEQKKEVIDKEEIQLHKDLDQLTNWVIIIIIFFYFLQFSNILFYFILPEIEKKKKKLSFFVDKNGGFHE